MKETRNKGVMGDAGAGARDWAGPNHSGPSDSSHMRTGTRIEMDVCQKEKGEIEMSPGMLKP